MKLVCGIELARSGTAGTRRTGILFSVAVRVTLLMPAWLDCRKSSNPEKHWLTEFCLLLKPGDYFLAKTLVEKR